MRYLEVHLAILVDLCVEHQFNLLDPKIGRRKVKVPDDLGGVRVLGPRQIHHFPVALLFASDPLPAAHARLPATRSVVHLHSAARLSGVPFIGVGDTGVANVELLHRRLHVVRIEHVKLIVLSIEKIPKKNQQKN